MGFGCRFRRRRRRRKGWKLGFSRFGFQSIGLPKIQRLPRISRVRDEKVEKIYSLLPKRDCGACGYESCYDCASAIARGEAPPDACRVVGKRIAPKVERILRGEA